jgi:hypothetical protein
MFMVKKKGYLMREIKTSNNGYHVEGPVDGDDDVCVHVPYGVEFLYFTRAELLEILALLDRDNAQPKGPEDNDGSLGHVVDSKGDGDA